MPCNGRSAPFKLHQSAWRDAPVEAHARQDAARATAMTGLTPSWRTSASSARAIPGSESR